VVFAVVMMGTDALAVMLFVGEVEVIVWFCHVEAPPAVTDVEFAVRLVVTRTDPTIDVEFGGKLVKLAADDTADWLSDATVPTGSTADVGAEEAPPVVDVLPEETSASEVPESVDVPFVVDCVAFPEVPRLAELRMLVEEIDPAVVLAGPAETVRVVGRPGLPDPEGLVVAVELPVVGNGAVGPVAAELADPDPEIAGPVADVVGAVELATVGREAAEPVAAEVVVPESEAVESAAVELVMVELAAPEPVVISPAEAVEFVGLGSDGKPTPLDE
jgi:hypothetical protein